MEDVVTLDVATTQGAINVPDPRDTGADDDSLIDALDNAISIEHPGGFQPTQLGVGMPPPIPEATEENMVCLRGPCRHLYQADQYFAAGNPAGTPGVERVMTTRFCLLPKGEPIDLTDECVYKCSHWDPSPDEELETRRAKWLASQKESA